MSVGGNLSSLLFLYLAVAVALLRILPIEWVLTDFSGMEMPTKFQQAETCSPTLVFQVRAVPKSQQFVWLDDT